MRIGHIELFVREPNGSRDFYERVLGFELVAVQGKNVWLKLGSTEILLRPGEPPPKSSTYAGVGIVIYADDLAYAADALRSRGLIFAGTDGSPKCLTFQDPDGHWFQLVNPNDH